MYIFHLGTLFYCNNPVNIIRRYANIFYITSEELFSSFFFFSNKLPIVVMRDVCPSVEIISFRGISISNKPIDLKMSMNVREGVVHARKAWFFEIRIASCNFLQFMQITKDIAVFPDNYRSCLSQLQLVAKRIVHSEQQVETTLNNTIHERYDFYTQ